MYEAEYRFALQNAGFDGFRVLLFQQNDGIKAASGEPGLKFTVDFGIGMLNALNLGDVNYIDSSGIGELVSAFTTVRNQGGELKLLNLTKKVHDLLQITKLYTVFDVKDDETTAVKSFTK